MSALAPNWQCVRRDICLKEDHQQQIASTGWYFWPIKSPGIGLELRKSSTDCRLLKRREIRAVALSPNMSMVEMETIQDRDQLDLILHQERHGKQPIIIVWMANWCRKCIHLKPKLEKLAAEFDTKVKFYHVDVNNVPQALVKHGNILKMPTIQLWEDGEMKAEVIGGHKAWLVMNEVREMIQPSM